MIRVGFPIAQSNPSIGFFLARAHGDPKTLFLGEDVNLVGSLDICLDIALLQLLGSHLDARDIDCLFMGENLAAGEGSHFKCFRHEGLELEPINVLLKGLRLLHQYFHFVLAYPLRLVGYSDLWVVGGLPETDPFDPAPGLVETRPQLVWNHVFCGLPSLGRDFDIVVLGLHRSTHTQLVDPNIIGLTILQQEQASVVAIGFGKQGLKLYIVCLRRVWVQAHLAFQGSEARLLTHIDFKNKRLSHLLLCLGWDPCWLLLAPISARYLVVEFDTLGPFLIFLGNGHSCCFLLLDGHGRQLNRLQNVRELHLDRNLVGVLLA